MRRTRRVGRTSDRQKAPTPATKGHLCSSPGGAPTRTASSTRCPPRPGFGWLSQGCGGGRSLEWGRCPQALALPCWPTRPAPRPGSGSREQKPRGEVRLETGPPCGTRRVPTPQHRAAPTYPGNWKPARPQEECSRRPGRGQPARRRPRAAWHWPGLGRQLLAQKARRGSSAATLRPPLAPSPPSQWKYRTPTRAFPRVTPEFASCRVCPPYSL